MQLYYICNINNTGNTLPNLLISISKCLAYNLNIPRYSIKIFTRNFFNY